MVEEELVVLTKGSRYRITSMETRDKPLVTHGIFRGYATIGPDDAICVELDSSHVEQSGKIRLIPCHMVIAIDIVEQHEESKEKEKTPGQMYG